MTIKQFNEKFKPGDTVAVWPMFDYMPAVPAIITAPPYYRDNYEVMIPILYTWDRTGDDFIPASNVADKSKIGGVLRV